MSRVGAIRGGLFAALTISAFGLLSAIPISYGAPRPPQTADTSKKMGRARSVHNSHRPAG